MAPKAFKHECKSPSGPSCTSTLAFQQALQRGMDKTSRRSARFGHQLTSLAREQLHQSQGSCFTGKNDSSHQGLQECFMVKGERQASVPHYSCGRSSDRGNEACSPNKSQIVSRSRDHGFPKPITLSSHNHHIHTRMNVEVKVLTRNIHDYSELPMGL